MQQEVVRAADWTIPIVDVGHILPMPGIEIPVPIEWSSFANSGYHAIAGTVLHQGSPVAQAYHDCGRLIVHLSPYDAVIGPLMSSRTMMFSAMAVKVGGQSVGFAGFSPFTPMLTCGMVPLPIEGAPGSDWNSVIVGMDPDLDYWLCWEGVAIEMAVGVAVSIYSAGVTILTAGAWSWGGAVVENIPGILAAEGMREMSQGQEHIEENRARHARRMQRENRSRGNDPAGWDAI